MDFIDHLRALGEKVLRLKDQITTEEATKNAFIMPFINALGYDVFNPTEVIPEFVADLGIKKGEKVDYCILKDGKPIIIVECKHWGEDLNIHNSQLHRYFHVTQARFGLLTNGIIYRFYTDLEEKNKMDDKPFLEFVITDIKENLIPEIKKFQKASFNVEEILSSASELKYAKEIRNILSNQLANPTEDFVKYFTNQVYQGRLTAKTLEQFTPIVKRSFTNFVSDLISDRLKNALENEKRAGDPDPIADAIIDVKEELKQNVTTELELEAFFVVKSILRNKIRSQRIGYRDNLNYLSVILDDSIRKPICRLWLNGHKKYLGTFDESGKEVRNSIETLEDIYTYSELLSKTALKYEEKVSV
jgi:hypothetical protein